MNFIADETAQKLRGGYYTPLDLAEFMALWVKEKRPQSILEPSCGDGVFLEALANIHLSNAKLLGFELNFHEAEKAKAKAADLKLTNAQINNQDFLEWALQSIKQRSQPFDAVLGNPPFVRYQYLPQPFQAQAEEIFQVLNLKFTKHTNAWVSFVLASLALLKPGGRLAMIVPSEIIHVTHAQSLRTYLGIHCSRLVLIDPEELWFNNTLQGAVILLAEKADCPTNTRQGLGIYPVKNREFLGLKPSQVFEAPSALNGKTVEGKWTRAVLDQETRDLLEEAESRPQVHRFQEVAKVDVGIVTGANKFFLVTDQVVEHYHLRPWAHPMFGRSEHCPGLIYDHAQHQANALNGYPTNFLWFPEDSSQLSAEHRAYIQLGESEGLNTRYKCRIRSPWYRVPSVYSTGIGMLKRSHDTPRLILNKAKAYTTDTAYRIILKSGDEESFVAQFLNPLTALSAELESRHYGGGVLELIPSEIEKLIIPTPSQIKIDINQVNQDLRDLPTQQLLRQQGRLVLQAIGLSVNRQEQLLAGWRKLKDRRQRVAQDASTKS